MYWFITILLPNGCGHAHFANAVVDEHPLTIAVRTGYVITNAIKIGKPQYDKWIEWSKEKYPDSRFPGIISIETSKT